MPETAGQLSHLFRNDEALDHTLDMRLKALRINRLLGSKPGMADNCHRLGILYALRGQLRQSIQMLEKARELELGLSRMGSLADCYYNLAAVQAIMGWGDKSINSYQQALSIDQQLGNMLAQIHDHLAIAHLLFKNAEYIQAETHLNMAMKLQQRNEYRPDVAETFTIIAECLLLNGKASLAVTTLVQAYDIYECCDHTCGRAEVTALLGVGYHLTGDSLAAEHCLSDAMKLNRALGRKIRQADCCANLANIYWSSGRQSKAAGMYRKALVLFIEMNCRTEAQRVRQLLGDLLSHNSSVS